MTDTPGLIHCVAFTWRPDTSAAAIEAVRAGLAALRRNLGLADYRFGEDLGLGDGNADFAVIARFSSADAWRSYMNHPEHQRLIADQVRPILATRVAFQIHSGSTNADPEPH